MITEYDDSNWLLVFGDQTPQGDRERAASAQISIRFIPLQSLDTGGGEGEASPETDETLQPEESDESEDWAERGKWRVRDSQQELNRLNEIEKHI